MKRKLPHGSMASAMVLCLLAAGCGRSGYDRYVPGADEAESALRASLEAWKQGRTPGTVAGQERSIQAADFEWQTKKKLKDYRILGSVPDSRPRRFSVELVLQNSRKPQRVEYVVVGRDPVWVFRDKDYEKSQTW